MTVPRLNHRFVEFFPERLDEGVLYIALEYATMSHRCACGCGEEVVTPLSPRDWKMVFDGETVSVSPSIGSWSLKCQSHYFIEKGRVLWADKWSPEKINAGRAHDLAAKRGGQQYRALPSAEVGESAELENANPRNDGIFHYVKRTLGKLLRHST